MTKDKFQTLCAQVLVPMIGEMLFRQLATIHEDIEAVAREVARVGNRLETLTREADRDQDA